MKVALCACGVLAAAALAIMLTNGSIFAGGSAKTAETDITTGISMPNTVLATDAATASVLATNTNSLAQTASPSPQPAATASPVPEASTSATPVPAGTEKPQATKTPAPTNKPSATPKPDKHADIGQAVVVIASGSSAQVALYEREGDAWEKLVETSGCVGKNGVTSSKREGDKKTPAGMYDLSFAFGTEKPDTALSFRQITDESYWVDDPESEYYNTWQEGDKGWKSAEKLSGYPLHYHYAVAIAYNTSCTPGRGSAIFLHCRVKSYTSGCVAVPEAKLLQILKLLDPAKKPVIIIGTSEKAINSYGVVTLPK